MDQKITITYETLFDILRNEKNREELQLLPANFYDDLLKYLKDKQKLIMQKPDAELFSGMEKEKTQKQFDNIKKIVKELYERREKKITNMALISSRTSGILDQSALLSHEKEMFNALIKSLDQFRANILLKLLKVEEPAQSRPEPLIKVEKPTRLVRFLQPVPKFLGKDLEVYGPFDEEDMANLPSELADVLISKGRVEEIKG
jgi:DNA replication initiation complex subunit (GINS family)